MEYTIKVVGKVSNTDQTLIYPFLSVKNTKHWYTMYEFMIGALVFSVCIKVCKNLQLQRKDRFLTKQTAASKCTTFSVEREEVNSYGELLCKHTTGKKS